MNSIITIYDILEEDFIFEDINAENRKEFTIIDNLIFQNVKKIFYQDRVFLLKPLKLKVNSIFSVQNLILFNIKKSCLIKIINKNGDIEDYTILENMIIFGTEDNKIKLLVLDENFIKDNHLLMITININNKSQEKDIFIISAEDINLKNE